MYVISEREWIYDALRESFWLVKRSEGESISTKTLEITVDGVNIIMKVIGNYYELGWYHETLVPI